MIFMFPKIMILLLKVCPIKNRIEGPFGDPYWFYTLEEEYPFMEITSITSKTKPTFLATVVGKPHLKINIWDMQPTKIFTIIKTTAP